VLLAVAFVLSAVITNGGSGYAAEVDYPFAAVQATGTYTGGSITWGSGITSGKGTDYPSTVTVSGLTGNISHISVTLTNLKHTRPDDYDILLVGPTGQGVMIMSDACGTATVDLTLTFDDSAAALLSNSATPGCSSGTYRPSNFTGQTGDTDAFPDAAYTSIAAALGAFTGTNPNGTWSLYVMDDQSSYGGVNASIGSWSITITTANLPPIVDPIGDMTLAPDSSATVQINASDPDGGTLAYQVTSSNSAVADVAVNATGLIDIQTGTTGSATITVTVSDGQGGSTVETFIVGGRSPAGQPAAGHRRDRRPGDDHR